MRKPTEFRREGSAKVIISWADGVRQELSAEVLRVNCPCAECRERRGDGSHERPLGGSRPSSLRVLSHSRDEELRIDSIWAIGNYALGIRWGDGHATGIYTYDRLYELGSPYQAAALPHET